MDLEKKWSDRQGETQQDRNIRYARNFILAFAAIGAGCVFIYSLHSSIPWLWVKALGSALLIANASFAIGGFLGFLFGIPRSVQAQVSEGKLKEDVHEQTTRLLYRGNTNLEQISDWLTKIIVGVGLVELKGAPTFLQRLAYFVGSSFEAVGAPRNDSIALSIVALFAVSGFFLAYLMARLFLQNALSAAESPIEGKIADTVDSVGAAAASRPPPDPGGPIPETEIRAGERIKELSRDSNLENLHKQILEVALSYDQLRGKMPSGAERTSSMEAIVARFRALAPATYTLLDEMANSDTAGKRLAAVVMLQLNPQSDYLEWLADRVNLEKPFVGYHAALALLYSAQKLGSQYKPALLREIKRAQAVLVEKGLVNTDRMEVLTKAQAAASSQ